MALWMEGPPATLPLLRQDPAHNKQPLPPPSLGESDPLPGSSGAQGICRESHREVQPSHPNCLPLQKPGEMGSVRVHVGTRGLGLEVG